MAPMGTQASPPAEVAQEGGGLGDRLPLRDPHLARVVVDVGDLASVLRYEPLYVPTHTTPWFTSMGGSA